MAKKYWENNGLANEEGNFVAVIDLELPPPYRPSRFTGKDKAEVAESMMEAFLNLQAEDARRKEEAKRTRKPDAAPTTLPKPEPPRPLTPDERFELTNKLNDPDAAPEAIVTIMQAQQGRALTTEEQKTVNEYWAGEGRAFVAEHPEYYADDRNRDALMNYLRTYRYAPTRNNLAIAYDALTERNLLILKPEEGDEEELTKEENNQQQQPPAAGAESSRPGAESATRRPRLTSVSTGIRSSDASATRPTKPATPKVTRAMIEAMPQAEYSEKLRDPAFRKAVDAL